MNQSQRGYIRLRQQPQLRPLPEAALLLEICSLLQPAQFFVRKRSSEKSEVLVTVSLLDAKSCGAETVPELVTGGQNCCRGQRSDCRRQCAAVQLRGQLCGVGRPGTGWRLRCCRRLLCSRPGLPLVRRASEPGPAALR